MYLSYHSHPGKDANPYKWSATYGHTNQIPMTMPGKTGRVIYRPPTEFPGTSLTGIDTTHTNPKVKSNS